MTDKKKKPIIGILGGIGAGKSTMAAEFGTLGCAVIDADRIARQILGTDAVKEKLKIDVKLLRHCYALEKNCFPKSKESARLLKRS